MHTNLAFLRKLSSHHAFQEGLVETGFIPKYQAELIPPSHPAPAHFIALATLATLLQELPATPTSLNDPHSPWDSANTFRVNHTAVRTIRWLDPERKSKEQERGKGAEGEVKVGVETHADGSYTLSIEKHTFRASGKLRGGDGGGGDTLTAYIGDTLYHDVRVVRLANSDEVNVFHQGTTITLGRPPVVKQRGEAHSGSLLSPMPGKIVKVQVKVGDKVAKGAPLVIMEAMKMEHTIRAPAPGVVESVRYAVGELVDEKKVLVTIAAE